MFTLLDLYDYTAIATSHKISHLEAIIKSRGHDNTPTQVANHITYDHDRYRVYHLPDSTNTTIFAFTHDPYPKPIIKHFHTKQLAFDYADEFYESPFHYSALICVSVHSTNILNDHLL